MFSVDIFMFGKVMVVVKEEGMKIYVVMHAWIKPGSAGGQFWL